MHCKSPKLTYRLLTLFFIYISFSSTALAAPPWTALRKLEQAAWLLQSDDDVSVARELDISRAEQERMRLAFEH